MGAPEMAVMTLPKAPNPLMRFQKSTATKPCVLSETEKQ